MNEQQLLFWQQLMQQNPMSFQNMLSTTGNASQYQPTSPNYLGSINQGNQNIFPTTSVPNEQYFPQGVFAYQQPEDTYPDLTGAAALQNAQSVGMYSNATTGQLNNVDPNLLRPRQPQNNAFLNALGSAFTPMSTETSTFRLGQSLAFNRNNPNAPQGQRNLNTLRGIGAAGKTLTSLLRTGFAGAAWQNRQNEALQDYTLRQGQQDFMPLSPQYQNGGTIVVEDRNDPRYKAYQDSLALYKVSPVDPEFDRYKKPKMKFTQEDFEMYYGKNNNIPRGAANRVQPIFTQGDAGYPVYAYPSQKVILDPTPQVTAANINPAGVINKEIPISANTIDTNQTVTPTYGQDIFQNIWRAQGKIASTAERKANPNWDTDTQIMYLRPPEELGINRQNDGRYATWNESYNNLVEGRDFMYSNPQFQNGGEITQEQYLTGSFVGEQQSQGIPTAEVENSEFLQYPSGQVAQVVGATHEQGGVDLALEPGTRVISDNLTLGGKTARDLKKQYDIEVKANDTFATAIEKYRKKIGIDKIDKEQEDLFSKLKENTGKDSSETTAINEAYLAKQIQDTEAAKLPLKQELSVFTDLVFQKQEQLKGDDVQLQFENGGTYTTNHLRELFKKHNLSEEKGMEVVGMLKQYQNGGMAQYYTANPNILPDYANQSFGATPFIAGDVANIDVANQRLLQQANLLPYTLRQSGLIDPQTGSLMISNPEAIANFQTGYNQFTAAVVSAAENNPNLTPEQRLQIKERAAQESFTNEGVRGIDRIYGNFTSSRGGFNLPYLTQEDKQKYPDLRFVGDVVDEKGEIKPQYVDLSPEAKTLLQQTVKTSGKSALDIGLLPTSDPQEAPAAQTEQQFAALRIPQTKTQTAALNLIDQTLPPPRGLQASRMSDAQYRNYEAIAQGFEPQLQQLYNQESAAINQLQGLTPSQRASAVAAVSANTQQAANQAIGSVNAFNQQEAARISNLNTDLFNRYSAISEAEKERFEQKTFAAMNATEADLQNWFQYNNQLAAVNRQQQLQANTLANLFPQYTFTSEGQVVSTGVPYQYNIPAQLTTTNQTKKK